MSLISDVYFQTTMFPMYVSNILEAIFECSAIHWIIVLWIRIIETKDFLFLLHCPLKMDKIVNHEFRLGSLLCKSYNAGKSQNQSVRLLSITIQFLSKTTKMFKMRIVLFSTKKWLKMTFIKQKPFSWLNQFS